MYLIPPYIFENPTNLILSGITGAGKTFWIKRLLSEPSMFKIPPKRIIFCYSIWQDAYKNMPGVEFRKGLDIPKDLGGSSTILVLDDLMTDVMKSKPAEDLFTKGSHHLNLTVIFIVQNLYIPGVGGNTIRLNTHYNILMTNKTDLEKIERLGRKTGLGKTLLLAYKDACDSQDRRYGYLVVDMSPHNSNPDLVLKTNVFPGENQIIYLPL